VTWSKVPGYEAAMDAAKDLVTHSYDGWWEDQVAEMAVDAAIPIIIEALARAAENEPFAAPMYWQTHQKFAVAEWLRSHLVTGGTADE